MIKKSYTKDGEHVGFQGGDTYYSLDHQFPEDTEFDDSEKPTEEEIAVNKAYEELAAMDSQIPRIAEDFYDILNDDQKANLFSGLRDGIELKKQKRAKYLELKNGF